MEESKPQQKIKGRPKNKKSRSRRKKKKSQSKKKVNKRKALLCHGRYFQNNLKFIQLCLAAFLDGNFMSTVMTIITLYSLFGDDVRILVTDKDGDPVFWILNIIALIAFSIEIIIASISKKDYFYGFFFCLDIISTLSLLLDIGWVVQPLFGSSDSSGATSAAQLARAGRASRVGTKAGRIVRIVRLIRLVKLYKKAQETLANEAENISKLEEELNAAQNGSLQEAENNMQRGMSKVKNMKKEQNNIHGPKKEIQSQSQVGLHSKKVSEVDQVQSSPIKNSQLTQNKLPPIPQKRNIVNQDIDGLSKPVVLDKYANDPLLNKQNREIDEENRQQITNENQAIQGDVKIQNKRENQDQQEIVFKETKVGARLSELTTRRVIILVMSIMFSIPIFNLDTYVEAVTSYDNGLILTQIFENTTQNQMFESLELFVQFHKDLRNPVVHTEFYNVNERNKACCLKYPSDALRHTNINNYKEDLRTDEYNLYTANDQSGQTVAFSSVNIKIDYELNAILSILRTFFVSVVLGGGAMLFSKDVEDLVVSPLEKMLEKVQRISENPLAAAQMEEQEALAMEELIKQGLSKELLAIQEAEKFETTILEKLIIKTGALLALGFGEAGAEIIAQNMSKGGEIDPMLPGRKMMAIFGFCDIRNFTDATEVLQTGVMLFVNEIAEITHATVDQFCGQSNKNIGDAFLLVWKFLEDDFIRKEDGSVELKSEKRIQELSDLPVLSFVRIIVGINQSKNLEKYKKNAGLNERLPNYSVKMGFGLHVGWAIEGAIGSNYKIDASYLSPNVNMSSRLEAATKQFGTAILVSGPLWRTLTPKCQRNLRHIDTVTVKGSLVPLEFFTVDLSLDALFANCPKFDKFDTSKLTNAQKKKKKVLERIKRNNLKQQIQERSRHIADLFDTDKEIVAMRSIFTKEFYEKWEVGFQAYIAGDWGKALTIIQETYTMLPNYQDGPSNTLIEVIKDNNGKPPADWKGFRTLTEK